MKYKIGDIVKVVPKYHNGCVSTAAVKFANTITEIVAATEKYEKPCYLLKGLEFAFPGDPDLGHIQNWWEEGLLEKV